jgi:hypothetical protein
MSTFCYTSFAKSVRDAIGDPNTGVHSLRIPVPNGSIAAVDLIVVLIFVYLYSTYMGYDFMYTLIAVLILGVIAHRMFCVRTGFDKILFP